MSGHRPWSEIKFDEPRSPEREEAARRKLECEIAAYERSFRGRWDHLRQRLARDRSAAP